SPLSRRSHRPHTKKPRSGGAPRRHRRSGVLLLDHLLGDLLCRRLADGLGGGGLLRNRRGSSAGGLGHGLAGVAVAGVVALALGGLAVAFAHGLAPGSVLEQLKNPRVEARARGVASEPRSWRGKLPSLSQAPTGPSPQWAQPASCTWPWLSRRLARCPSPTRVPPSVIATACGTTEWWSGGDRTPTQSTSRPGTSSPSARTAR